MGVDRLDLRARLVGFLFFLPILLSVLAGSPYTVIGMGLAGLWVCYEASSLLGAGQTLARRRASMVALMGLFLLPILVNAAILSSLVAGGIGFVLIACAFGILKTRERVFVLLISATLISLSYVSMHPLGIHMLLSLALIISACDIGAYFSGRLIGGPKLAPSVSPSKTWAGSIGGIVCALIAAACLHYLLARLPLSSSAIIFVLLIAILSQIGDLFESSMKRRLGIKDSGQIVPGHGGALDRFDGYLTSLPVAAIMLHFEFPLLANLATL